MAVAEAMRKRSPAMAVDFARAVKVKPGEPHHHLQRWRAAMALRPSMSL